MYVMDHKWIDKLFDDIDELITDSKQVKFNTHKNRKVIMGKIKSMFIGAIETNTIQKPIVTRATTPTITRPNPNKSVGHAVMTEAASQRADELSKGVPIVPLPENARFR